MKHSPFLKNVMLSSIRPHFDNSKLNIYFNNTLLVQLQIGITSIQLETIQCTIPTTSTVLVTGTMNNYKLFKSDNTTLLGEGSIGILGSNSDLEVESTELIKDFPCTLNSFFYVPPE